ncbi:hypothetical protein EDD85DRAFT_776670 [Armillaria nabsnona]|nr:hypothetical protein EDD85DRAFT_776670 [Armillaria nabsnona]
MTRTFASHTSPDVDDGVSVCIEDRRTALSIVWSSLATIFACTWLAVHPNVPGRNITTKGTMSCVIERAKIMAITILVPEAIVAWAAEQFMYNSIASVINPWTEQKDNSKLTLAHGFLLSMGGFYYTRKCEIPPQAPETKIVTSTPPSPSPSAVSAETIEDKSKGDALSKTFSILQISWFIVQCIARAIQHLPITLLEMTALSFASLSIITYLLWWYKPLNVKYQISLDGSEWKPMPPTNDSEEFVSLVNPSWAEWATRRWGLFIEWIAHTTLGGSTDEYYENIGDGAFRFYSGTEEELSKRFMTMVGVGSLFGAFHCVAWSFYFPSHAEMVLWRFSSIAVLIGLFTWMVYLAYISIVMTVAAIVSYIVARIMLIILAVLQLRSLPPLAFHTVQWITYIPHI